MSYDRYREDMEYEMGAKYDYVREAHGDPCPNHPGVLRGGGDCWICFNDAYSQPEGYIPEEPSEAPAKPDHDTRGSEGYDDDDIPF
jgi:hypothetical protein